MFSFTYGLIRTVVSPQVLVLVTFVLVRARGEKKRILKRSKYPNSPEHLSSYSTTDEKSFWTSDRKTANKIRFAKEGIASAEECPATTVPRMLKRCVEKAASKPALRIEYPTPAWNAQTNSAPPSKPFDEWKTWTYQQYFDECCVAARAFITLGLHRFDAVTIYVRTRAPVS